MSPGGDDGAWPPAYAPAMTTPGPTSQRFVSQRLRLHFADWGNGDKPPLLLVHGGRDHCRSWDWTAQELREDWHVIAMDLRGHGDSDWTADGNYTLNDMVYDVAQLVHQLELAPVTIVAHSMGGSVCTRYAGVFPDKVRKLVAIEGLAPRPDIQAAAAARPYSERVREWIEAKRTSAGRLPRRYPTLADALARMRAENAYLSEDQARHLTVHGINRNEDGTFTWKFDPHLNVWPPSEASEAEARQAWSAITCPMLMLYGSDSFASNPVTDGRIEYFGTAEVIEYENAGHWLHHDQFDGFIAALRKFL
jgi:pimeloyl-ACP methyl ester carboxylesterase